MILVFDVTLFNIFQCRANKEVQCILKGSVILAVNVRLLEALHIKRHKPQINSREDELDRTLSTFLTYIHTFLSEYLL